jgi:hypothetical protein
MVVVDLGGLTLMPLRLGTGLFVLNADAWKSLAGHLAFGFVLGTSYAFVNPTRPGAHREYSPSAPPPSA